MHTIKKIIHYIILFFKRIILNECYSDINVNYYIDILVNDYGHLYVTGWLFDKNGQELELSILMKEKKSKKLIVVENEKRIDVKETFSLTNDNVGFKTDIFYSSNDTGVFLLTYKRKKIRYYIEICRYMPTDHTSELIVYGNKNLFDIKKYNIYKSQINEKKCKQLTNCVDIIIPVYNGYEYLEKLFEGIEKTKSKYRVFIINDNSPDERVRSFLINYSNEHNDVIYIENEDNLGFVKSVNKAIALSTNDVAIVNTDVILPEYWLERLMFPIEYIKSVASTTPFTNSGTICSFPVFCENNDIFLNKTVDEIDNMFSTIVPMYNRMPTGVGFCMGMKRSVINKIGLFDEDSFGKGYCEENDWCQRVIERGYSNVMVENLFVWHKHGGSFLSEDKIRYIERNHKLLIQKHPHYDEDVAAYCRRDPAAMIREFIKWEMLIDQLNDYYCIIDHNWGGGANTYCFDRIDEINSNGIGAIRIINDIENGLFVECRYKGYSASIYFDDYEDIMAFLADINIIKIVVNETVSFDNPKTIQDFVLRLKQKYNVDVLMLVHDYYVICPSIYLIDNEGTHCYYAGKEKCQSCFAKNTEKFNNSYSNIDDWRRDWNEFLSKCDEIRVFSNNTKSYLMHYYKNIDKTTIVPHKVNYISSVKKQVSKYDGVTIAIIGNFMRTKGAEIVCEMADIIKKKKINAKIVVIGSDLYGNDKDNIIVHGQYKREDLPELMVEYDVDIIFIASIWPETFSYTTEEAMLMGMPIACFDIGAPAERVEKYEKGLVIDDMNAEKALEEIIFFTKNGKMII